MLEKTTKYAIKALLHLVRLSPDAFIQVSKLSKEVQVPGPYLSKIIKTLAAKGIVATRKGINGGVRVTPRLRELSFYDIAVALDDPIVHAKCLLNNQACSRSNNSCPFHEGWSVLREQVSKHLAKLKLTDA